MILSACKPSLSLASFVIILVYVILLLGTQHVTLYVYLDLGDGISGYTENVRECMLLHGCQRTKDRVSNLHGILVHAG